MSQRPRHTARIALPQAYWQQCRFAMPAPLDSYYDEEVMADAPVLYWPLGEASDVRTAVDLSGNERHGAYNGAPVQGPVLVPGMATAACATQVPQTSAFISSAPFDVMSHVSVEVWVRPPPVRTEDPYSTAATPTLWRHANFWNGDNLQNSGFEFQLFTSGAIQLLGDSGARVSLFSQSVPDPDTRPTEHLVALVQASVGAALYLNGAVVNSDGVAYPVASASYPFAIGDYLDHALVSHMTMYQGRLPNARIAAHYAAGLRDPATMNRGGIGFGPDTCRFEGPPQRWHFPASLAPRGSDSFTLFVVCQLSYTGGTQMLLHATAQPVAASGFQLDWTTTSGFRWSEVGDTGTTTTATWSAATGSRHVLAIVHAGGVAPAFAGYADGTARVLTAGRTWSAQNTLTLGTYIGPISVFSGAVQSIYLVASALAPWEVARISEALA